MGMDEYLSKPIAAQSLIALISRTALNAENSPEAAASFEMSTAELPLHEERGVVARFENPLIRMQNDRTMLVEQMGFFLEDAPTLFQQLSDSTVSSEEEKTRLLAHRLKGLAFSFDANELAGTLAAIELEPISQDSSMRDAQLSEVNEGIRRLTNEINHYLSTA